MSERDPNRDLTTQDRDWLQPSFQAGGLSEFLKTIRERRWLIALAVVVTVGAAIVYLATQDKVYEAEAGILVNPAPEAAETLISLGALAQSNDPLRNVQTAAALVETNEVAERAQAELEGVPEASGDADDLLGTVRAEPVAESDIIAVTAEASTPEAAARIANTFVTATIAERSSVLHERIDERLPVLRERLRSNPDEATEINAQIAELELLRAGPDPTLQVATEAEPDSTPVSPRPMLSIAAGLLAGLALGVGGAFAYQVLDPRLRREEQLRSAFRLPILARIPRESRMLRTDRSEPISPHQLSPPAMEAYRALRAMLSPFRPGDSPSRSLLVTSASASEGKTTTAINLAASLAVAGRSVILIEGDLRKPQIATALGISGERGLVSVLLGETTLEDALVSTQALGPDLKVLLAEQTGPWVSEVFASPIAHELVQQAKALADYVIIDSAPLSEVVDALPLARVVDDVLIVAQLGKTRVSQVTELGELLAENGVKPVGFALLGVSHVGRGYAYVDGRPTRLRRRFEGERASRLRGKGRDGDERAGKRERQDVPVRSRRT